MRRSAIFAAMLAIAASCSINEIDNTVEEAFAAPEIFASYEGNDTKTTLVTDEDGVGTIWWTPADEINVFFDKESTHYISDNTENATEVTFRTEDTISSTEANDIWGLYPYDAEATCDGSSVTTQIPCSQLGVAGTFDDDIFTSLAHSASTTMKFYNVLGGIKFCLDHNGIKKITFRGNNDEDIAGDLVELSMNPDGLPEANVLSGHKTITLTPKEGDTFEPGKYYYLVMLPTYLSEGFTMTFETDTNIGTFNLTNMPVVIKRSVFGKKDMIDTYATFVSKQPLTITSTGNSTIEVLKEGSPSDIQLKYRIGDGDWEEYRLFDSIALTDGESVQFCGNNEGFSIDPLNYYRFRAYGERIDVSGNIMSLLDESLARTTLPENCTFSNLFMDCGCLVDASGLVLPAKSLSYKCYRGMFSGCINLTAAPELPATSLANECYYEMFKGCSSLAKAPSLPARSLTDQCYYGMFEDCSSLDSAPRLPATTLESACYSCMFKGCSKLYSAPELPATELAPYCYAGMFYECGDLSEAPELPAATLATACYYAMFVLCTSLPAAPVLPATELVDGCYNNMFYGCCSLSYLKALFTTKPSSDYTDDWTYGVSPAGIFVKSKDATWDVSGEDGIPYDWDVYIDE